MSRTGKVEQSDLKSPSTRLLDLLAGWSAFVSTDEENQVRDEGASSETIGELYQLAGTQSAAWHQRGYPAEEAAVRQFVSERVMPLLLARGRKVKPGADANGSGALGAEPPPAAPKEPDTVTSGARA